MGSRHAVIEQVELALGGQSAAWEALEAATRERTIDQLSQLLAQWYGAANRRVSEERRPADGEDR